MSHSFTDSCDTLVFTLQVLIVFPSFNCNFFKKYKNYINIYIVHTILHVVLYMHPIPCFFLLLIMSKLVIWINFNKYTYFNYPDWDSMTWHHTKESHNHGIPWNSKPLPYIYQCFLKLFVKDDISLHQTRGFCLGRTWRRPIFSSYYILNILLICCVLSGGSLDMYLYWCFFFY